MNAKTLVASLACVVLLAGCAGTGLRHAGVPGESWYRIGLPQEGEEGDEPLDKLEEEIRKGVDRGENPLIILGVIVGTWLLIDAVSEDDEEEHLSFAASQPSRPQPPVQARRWQEKLEEAATARVSLWQRTPLPRRTEKARMDLNDGDADWPDEDNHLGRTSAREAQAGKSNADHGFAGDGAGHVLKYEVLPDTEQ